MKLISTFQTTEAAQALRERLELAGIAVIVQTPVKIRNDSSAAHLVFAALEAQHSDAMELLRNPQHSVQHRVDMDTFTAHLRDSDSQKSTHQSITRGLSLILLALMLAMAAFVLLILR